MIHLLVIVINSPEIDSVVFSEHDYTKAATCAVKVGLINFLGRLTAEGLGLTYGFTISCRTPNQESTIGLLVS